MTRSNGFDQAKYYEEIQKEGLLLTERAAARWSEAVLRTLSLNIDRGTKKRLAKALPDKLASDLNRTFWLLHFRDPNKSSEEFLKEVAKRSGNTDAEFARTPTKAIFHQLKEMAGDDVSDAVSDSLAPEIRTLWQEA